MRTLTLALAAAGTLAATPALAQTGDPTFSGFRAGVVGGYDGIQPGDTERTSPNASDERVNGFLYGVDAGFDFDLGGVVLGVEGELTGSTGKVEDRVIAPNTFGFGRVSTGRDLYVGGRLGLRAAPETLVYAKAGYTNARLDVLASNGTRTTDENFELGGFRIGAGAEQRIGANTYAKLEYRYSNYSRADFEFTDGNVSNRFDIDTDRHQVVAGVGFRF